MRYMNDHIKITKVWKNLIGKVYRGDILVLISNYSIIDPLRLLGILVILLSEWYRVLSNWWSVTNLLKWLDDVTRILSAVSLRVLYCCMKQYFTLTNQNALLPVRSGQCPILIGSPWILSVSFIAAFLVLIMFEVINMNILEKPSMQFTSPAFALYKKKLSMFFAVYSHYPPFSLSRMFLSL